MTKDEALDLALEALEGIHPGNMTPMAEEYWNKAITAIKQARALDKMAENARELGLDYEPVPVQQKPLFADIIAKHPGLAEELKAMHTAPTVQEPLGYWLIGTDHVEFDKHEYHDGPEWEAIYTTPPAQPAPVQDLPFGVGGGLVAIKTLLSRDPCVHANTAIGMIDAIKQSLAAQPAVPEGWKLVPVDAVPEIMGAAIAVHDKWGWRNFPAMWDAMLSAATAPPAQPAPVQEPVALRPEDVTVEVLMVQSGGGFAPLKTHGVKLTHKPTGIVVQCSSERSQHRNREQALRDLERYLHGARPQPTPPAAQSAPVQEPVFELQESGWEIICDLDWIQTLPFGTKLYTTPPAAQQEYERGVIDGRQMQAQSSVDKAVNAMSQRQWVGLTDDEIDDLYQGAGKNDLKRAREIEAKLKEKNNG